MNLTYCTTKAIGYAVPDIPVTKGNANKFHMGRQYLSINEIPKVPKLPRYLSEGDNAIDTKDKTQRHHMPAGPLVDITNYMATGSGKNTDHFANGKRVIGGRNSISPFKRPRSSRSFDLHPV